MADPVNIPSAQVRMAQLATFILQLRAQITNVSEHTWSDATGAGYEGLFNAGGLGPNDKPLNGLETIGDLTQSMANNFISAIDSIGAAIDLATAPIAVVSEFNPAINNSSPE